VVLAAGRGTRLAEARPGVALSARQEAAAQTGLKALMPVPDRPLVDSVLEALRAVGVRRFGVVLGRRHEALAAHLRALPGLDLTLLEQAEPRGTADAVLAAADFARDVPFLVINSDTYYPSAALAALVALPGPGLLALDRAAVLADGRSNLTDAKLSCFALVDRDANGDLSRLIEKPDDALWAARVASGGPVLLSINAFRLDPTIFDFCRRVPPSSRGELELPAAVALAVAAGCRFRVAVTGAPILDLTERADVAVVSARLAERELGRG
jgi:glucose-1-phosphate thymidylyltransferase